MLLDINECSVTRPCSSLANCINTIGSYQCGCRAGYSGNGVSCVGRLYKYLLHVANEETIGYHFPRRFDDLP